MPSRSSFIWQIFMKTCISEISNLSTRKQQRTVVQFEKFLKINLSSCHCSNTFQLNADGFLEEGKMPWNYQNKMKKSLSMGWDMGMLWLFKNGRQAPCCAYDILLYENMMRVSYSEPLSSEGKQTETASLWNAQTVSDASTEIMKLWTEAIYR
jgi:hypothetical protein